MKTEPGGGSLKCHVPSGKYLVRDNRASANNDTWIYVRWMERWKGGKQPQHMGVNFKQCLDWDQHGWVLKSDLQEVKEEIARKNH